MQTPTLATETGASRSRTKTSPGASMLAKRRAIKLSTALTNLRLAAAGHWHTPATKSRFIPRSDFGQYVLAISVVIGVALASYFLVPLIGVHAIALIFLLAVVVLALFVNRGPTFLAATMSALLWDFFFIRPVFSFRVAHFEDGMLLLMYFAVALVLGQLTGRIHAQEMLAREREARATALYDLTRELSSVANVDQLAQRVLAQLEAVFGAEAVILLAERPYRLSRAAHPASTYLFPEHEWRAAVRAFDYGQPSGRFTDDFPDAAAFYVPLIAGGSAVGVIGLKHREQSPPPVQQWQLLNAFARQIAVAFDRQRLDTESEQAQRLAESERLSKTFLNSMSHELRTPLAAIKTATAQLSEIEGGEFSTEQTGMIAEVQEAVERLDRLVGKVLDSTRLEAGRVKPRMSPCDVSDLVHVATKDVRKELAQHKLTVEIAPALPLVNADFVLLQEALMNLLSNAATHTPPGTLVTLKGWADASGLNLCVSDEGPGLDPESLRRAFDKFYRGPSAPTGGSGLGLSLVKGFVEAQGGTVKAANQPEGGAIFTIRLPLRPVAVPAPD